MMEEAKLEDVGMARMARVSLRWGSQWGKCGGWCSKVVTGVGLNESGDLEIRAWCAGKSEEQHDSTRTQRPAGLA
jgi:hypothetical protein